MDTVEKTQASLHLKSSIETLSKTLDLSSIKNISIERREQLLLKAFAIASDIQEDIKISLRSTGLYRLRHIEPIDDFPIDTEDQNATT